MIARIRKFFCRHVWIVSRLQALSGGTSFQCSKCGKYDHRD